MPCNEFRLKIKIEIEYQLLFYFLNVIIFTYITIYEHNIIFQTRSIKKIKRFAFFTRKTFFSCRRSKDDLHAIQFYVKCPASVVVVVADWQRWRSRSKNALCARWSWEYRSDESKKPDGLVHAVIPLPFEYVQAAAEKVKNSHRDERLRMEKISATPSSSRFLQQDNKYIISVPLYMQPLLGAEVHFSDRVVESNDSTNHAERFRIEQSKNISFASIANARETLIYAPHPDPTLARTHSIWERSS